MNVIRRMRFRSLMGRAFDSGVAQNSSVDGKGDIPPYTVL